MTRNKILLLVFGLTITVVLVIIYQYNQPIRVKSYYNNGSLETEYTLVNNYKQGEYLEYYPSGVVKRKFNYNLGKIHGRNTEYYKDGSISLVFFSNNGLQEGHCIQYFSNGEVAYSGYYFNDNRVGAHGWYHNDGTLRRIIEYDSTGLDKGYYDYLEGNVVDSVKTPYFIPHQDSDSMRSESPYNARIFLGNREKDSLKISVSKIWVNDSMIKSDIEILELDRYHADYKIWPKKSGIYKFYVFIEEFDSLGLFSKTDFIYADTLNIIY